MWKQEIKKNYEGVSVKEVWDVWKDIDSREKWSEETESAKIDGVFKEGELFNIKLKGLPMTKVTIADVVENKGFSEEVYLPGAKLVFKHSVEELGSGVEITETLTITGMTSAMLGNSVGTKLVEKLPKQMDDLVSYLKKTKV